MKGVVFNLLEAVVRRDYGEDTWETLLEAANVDGARNWSARVVGAEVACR